MKKEVYKDIKGYEGLYQISNFGNVKSLDRIDSLGRLRKGRDRKTSDNGKGYLHIWLFKEGSRKTHYIHQLVAINFLDHKVNGWNKVVNHKDHNRSNNRLDNLEIISQRENSNQKHMSSTSKYTGVHWKKDANKWCSKIYINGKYKFLGYFENELDASNAYQTELNNLNK